MTKLDFSRYDIFMPTSKAMAAVLESYLDDMKKVLSIRREMIAKAMRDGARRVIMSGNDSIIEGFVFNETPPKEYKKIHGTQNIYTVDGIEKASFPVLNIEGLTSLMLIFKKGRHRLVSMSAFRVGEQMFLAVPKEFGQQHIPGFAKVSKHDVEFMRFISQATLQATLEAAAAKSQTPQL